MKKSKRNICSQAEEIIRYLEDKMTPAERNAFERKLQSDPFLAEAVEGYSLIEPGWVDNDIEKLQAMMSSRTRRKSTILYRVVAAVIVLVAISSVLLVKNLRQPDLKMAEGRGIEAREAPQMPVPESAKAKAVTSEDMGIGKQELKELPEEKGITEYYDLAADSAFEDAFMIAEEEIRKGEKDKEIADAALEETPVKGKETEAAERITGVTARPETMKKARRMNEVAAVQDEAFNISRDAQPVVGEKEYLKYLENKQVYPVGYEDAGRVVVRLELIIEDNGTIEEIKITENPAKVFSDEAIRLVKEGPVWLPALKEGQAVRDTIVLKVIFKVP